MALIKEKTLDNGVTLNYHRIVSINNITNIVSTIEVASYTNEAQREKEKKYQAIQQKSQPEELTENEQETLNNGINIYIDTKFYNIPYDKELNVDTSYNYLKGLEEFKGAKDI